MEFLNADGAALHVAATAANGDAPTVVFINALGTDFRIWDPVVDRLPPNWGTIRYDKRGHGLSGLGTPPYALSVHVSDLDALTASHDGPLVVCGLSVGALIAQSFALTRPDRVAALVLCCAAARFASASVWEDRMVTVAEKGLEALLDPTMERWFTSGFRTAGNPIYEGMRTMFVRQSTAGYIGTCATLRDSDLSDAIGSISVPTLCVAGAHDGSAPPDTVRAVAGAIPNAEFTLIEDAGHIPCVETPVVLAQAITVFLAKHGLG